MIVPDPYLAQAEAQLRVDKARLESRSVSMRSPAPAFSVLARRRKLLKFESRYAEVNRRFELLRTAGPVGRDELKIALEKAWEAFRLEPGWKP